MVNSRVNSHTKNTFTSRYRKSSVLPVTLYVILLSTLSISIFVLYSKDISEHEHDNMPLVRIEHSTSDKLLYDKLWATPSSRRLRPCTESSSKYKAIGASDRYMTVRSNGGLNQMRTGIADMVAVAHIMNATLVIPQLDKRSFWQDTSTFADVFDELHFIKSLQQDVRIVKELPKELESVPHARKHFTTWSGVGYYEEMRQLWKEYQVIHVAKSDSRLANNDLPVDIQRLRCRALYHGLRFSPTIENLGKRSPMGIRVILGSEHKWLTPQKLVERLKSNGQRYIAVHLRYEKDMLSFTGCTYGLTDAESEELRLMREKTSHWKIKNINATEQRIGGLCPLTPKEVGLFLEALGYPSSTTIYIAAGEIYGGEAHLSELTSRFPKIVFKEMLASQQELKPYLNHASQTAALDYIVSIESDIFIPSHSGNMARVVEGHRRFLWHRKTITPDRGGLVVLFDKLEAGLIERAAFSRRVKQLHKNRQGAPRKRGGAPSGIRGRARLRLEESFYQNPYPECICESQDR